MYSSKKWSCVFIAAVLLMNPLSVDSAVHISAESDEDLVRLGARELQRYIVLRTATLPKINPETSSDDSIVLGLKGSGLDSVDHRISELGAQEFLLKTDQAKKTLYIIGGDPQGLLYGAYRLIEHMGVRFHLHGDVIPDEKAAWKLPQLDELGKPLFSLRGILPFHDFPEGPDWWEADDYKAYFAQLAKMRMNFIGLHCYPETRRGTTENSPAEPLIWLGLEKDVNPDGTVKSSYETYWANTAASGKWGYGRTKTSDFAAGGGLLFDKDYFGHSLFDDTPLKPVNDDGYTLYQHDQCTPEEMMRHNDVFNRTGRMLNDVFSFGHELGIQNAIGTQVPLEIPAVLDQQLKDEGESFHGADRETLRKVYEGTFSRIAKTYPIDYYWLWTHEGWLGVDHQHPVVQQAVNDKLTAYQALQNIGAPFQLATSGWVLGPKGDRTLFDRVLPKDMPFSCINTHIGFAPVEPAFAEIEQRGKWAIPWLEDDASLISPQLWVGRTRRDAADAHAYGCDGLMGIHWRTKVLSPNLAALAQAGWSQQGWNKTFGIPYEPPHKEVDVHVGGQVALYDQKAVKADDASPVYLSLRYGMDAYRLQIPNGTYDITLQFCELYHDQPNRRLFSVALNGNTVEEKLDVLAQAGVGVPLERSYKAVQITDEQLEIAFNAQQDSAILSGIVIEGRTADHNQIKGKAYSRAINCGGPAVETAQADLASAESGKGHTARDRDLASDDFYQDWCRTEFGPVAGDSIAAIFDRIDGGKGDYSHGMNGRHNVLNMPHPSVWAGGPGSIRIRVSDWDEERKRYAFVDELEALRSKVKGAGNRERFDYWLNTFKYNRTMGHLGCIRKQLDEVMVRVDRADEKEARRLAKREALPLRIKMARLWEEMSTYLLQTVSTPGEMGTVANLEQHVRRNARLPVHRFLDKYDARLTELTGELPREVEPRTTYTGAARIIVPTKRTLVSKGEALSLKVIVLDAQPPKKVQLYWRVIGQSEFRQQSLELLNRRTYTAALPTDTCETLEYFITATTSNGKLIQWPATAPTLNQTVVIY